MEGSTRNGTSAGRRIGRRESKDAGLEPRKRWTAFGAADAPVRGSVWMSKSKAAQTALDLRQLIGTLREMWPP